jgi:hypothetical protein
LCQKHSISTKTIKYAVDVSGQRAEETASFTSGDPSQKWLKGDRTLVKEYEDGSHRVLTSIEDVADVDSEQQSGFFRLFYKSRQCRQQRAKIVYKLVGPGETTDAVFIKTYFDSEQKFQNWLCSVGAGSFYQKIDNGTNQLVRSLEDAVEVCSTLRPDGSDTPLCLVQKLMHGQSPTNKQRKTIIYKEVTDSGIKETVCKVSFKSAQEFREWQNMGGRTLYTELDDGTMEIFVSLSLTMLSGHARSRTHVIPLCE